MKILIDIGHPGHVHLLKNFYFEMKKKGHFLIVSVKDLPAAKELLLLYNINFVELGIKNDSLFGKAISQLKYNLKVFSLVLRNKIEIGIGSSITIAHISKLTKMKSIILDDDNDDVQPLFVKYAHPFCDTILSPSSLIGHRQNKKTIFYDSFHELAYLHPNRFNPDISVLSEIGLTKEDTFFLLRFNVFKAHHDIGIQGLSLIQKKKLIKYLEIKGKVFITTEREIEPELQKYQLRISAEKTHSLMYYSTMFLGDSQTMTSEAAVLGVPSIRMNSFVGRIAYLEEEEHKYGLTFGFKPNNFSGMIIKVKELLQISDLKQEFQKHRARMLNDKIDLTSFIVWFVENYPKSFRIMKENNNHQNKFK